MKIIPKSNCETHDPRYVIADDEGKIVDDAQGYGYKTKRNAYKAMYYQFKGGKQKKQQETIDRKKIFKQYPGLEKFISNLYENNFKELFREEITEEDFLQEIKEKFGIDFPKKYLVD